jgi:hypothetical protein
MKIVGNEWYEKENVCFLATVFLWIILPYQ